MVQVRLFNLEGEKQKYLKKTITNLPKTFMVTCALIERLIEGIRLS